MACKIISASTVGLNGEVVEVEVDVLGQGLHNFTIVGLADTAIKESRDRVSSAIKNSGFKPVHQCGRVTVNLAPADLPKLTPIYDVPIALGVLIATKQISFDFSNKLIVGELSLDGNVRPIQGALSIALLAKKHKIKDLYVPRQNSAEASVVDEINVYPIDSLYTLVQHLTEIVPVTPVESVDFESLFENQLHEVDMSHIKGQQHVKRALEIAAAGGHNILMSGPPGSGKTLLAKAASTILPKLSLSEALEVTQIHSVAGKLPRGAALVTKRPYRSPHNTASSIALVGGGNFPRPGEISLAHRGVLFLDEFGEFPKHVLENLRQPLEDGTISISRAKGTLEFPARFILIAAMNPCPCGNATDPDRMCSCTPAQVVRYRQKISGPIIDRIDLHVDVPRLSFDALQAQEKGETSELIRERVEKCRKLQRERFVKSNFSINSEMKADDIAKHCRLSESCVELLKQAVSAFKLSARAYHRIIKISRTIADLAEEKEIQPHHLAEALQYRVNTEI